MAASQTVTGTVWITGLPASGKTTLSTALHCALLARGYACTLLDGEVLRQRLSRRHGHSLEERFAGTAGNRGRGPGRAQPGGDPDRGDHIAQAGDADLRPAGPRPDAGSVSGLRRPCVRVARPQGPLRARL